MTVYGLLKKTCSILAWISNKKGEGLKLLRHAKRWFNERPVLRALGMCLDIEVDEKVWRLMDLEDFECRGGTLVLFKR